MRLRTLPACAIGIFSIGVLMCVFSRVNAAGASAWRWIYLVTLPLYVLHLKGVWTHSGRALDHLLPMLVISTFVLSVLAGLGIML